MKKMMKRTAAAVLSLAIVGGAVPPVVGVSPLKNPSVTAKAADNIYFDSETGVLTLDGEIDPNSFTGLTHHSDYISGIKKIIATENCVLSQDCSYLFYDLLRIDEMVYGSSLLTSIDLSKADASKVERADSMFAGFDRLYSVKLPDFSSGSLVEATYMFQGCSSLTSLDLSRMNTSNLWKCASMFSGCESLKTITVSSLWNMNKANYSSDMFNGCAKFVGRYGTKCNWTLGYDRTYARIDLPGYPGYLTSNSKDTIIEGEVYTLAPETGPVDDIVISYDNALVLNDVYVQFDDRYEQGWGIKKVSGIYRFNETQSSGYYYKIRTYDLKNVNVYTLANITDGSMEPDEYNDITCVRYGDELTDSIIAGIEITTGTGTAEDPYILEPYTLALPKVNKVECIDDSALRFNMLLPHDIDSVTFSGADGDVTYTRENDFDAAKIESYFYSFDYPFTLANASEPVSVTVTAYGKPARIVKTTIVDVNGWKSKWYNADTSGDTYVPKDYLSEVYSSFVNGDYMLGDVNGDKQLDLHDVDYLYQYVNGQVELSATEKEYIEKVGDVFCPGDGIDEKDYFALYTDLHYVNPEGPFPLYGSVIEFDNSWEPTDNRLYGENYVIGASLTLDGSIGVNFQVNLGEKAKKAVLDGPSGEVVITDFDNYQHIGSGAYYNEYSDKWSYKKYRDGSYMLSYYVDATQMNDKVTLRLYDENDNLLDIRNSSYVLDDDKTIEYSIADYISNYKSKNKYTDALVNSLDNYCKAASNYFNGTDYSIEGIEDINTDELNELAGSLDSKIKLSLVLDTKTSMRVYSDNSTIKLDGQKPELQTSKYGNFYEIPNIAAQELTELHTLTMDDDGPVIYRFSPMIYVKRVLENPDASEELKNVAKSIYVYAMAAKNYMVINSIEGLGEVTLTH
ncbi:MAG: BspA family leucine-rich repeat surface protein [Ruminococcus sp.]|nr:BspA family leucine-rich repeat surface protein [Ruminococcus sp.]